MHKLCIFQCFIVYISVFLCLGPAINDITYQELELLLHMIASFEPLIAESLNNGKLMLAENGQTSPCLDFRLIASSLVQLAEREQVKLYIYIYIWLFFPGNPLSFAQYMKISKI